MAKILYGFKPKLNGFFPYGGFLDNTNIKPDVSGLVKAKNRKPSPPTVKKPKV
jgi:hypothetical protein